MSSVEFTRASSLSSSTVSSLRPLDASQLALKRSSENAADALEDVVEEDAAIEQAIAQLIEGDFHGKWDSAKRFAKQFAQWGDRTVPHLVHHLNLTTDAENQWFLIRVLSQFDRPEAVAAIAQILATTTDEDLQIEATKALTRLGESAIAALSAQLADHYDDRQRLLATRALSHIRRSATLDPLLRVAADPNAEIRAIALEALGSFHDPRITPILLAALNDESAICIESIRTLGRRRDLMDSIDLIMPLARCLSSPVEKVARESAIALGRLGGEAATDALGKLLTLPAATAVKVSAARALGWMNTEQAITYLSVAFEAEVPVVMPAVKQEIARSLGQARAPELKAQAAQPLLNWLKASRQSAHNPANEPANGPEIFRLKQTIISALAGLSASAALDTLCPLLSDPDPRIQMHALNALKQIDPRAAQAKVQTYLKSMHISPEERQQVIDSLAAW